MTVPPLTLPLGGDSHEIWSVRGGAGRGSVDRRASGKDASAKGTRGGGSPGPVRCDREGHRVRVATRARTLGGSSKSSRCRSRSARTRRARIPGKPREAARTGRRRERAHRSVSWLLLTSFPDQPLALACVPGAERVSSQLDANEARGTTRGRRHPPRHAVTAPVRGGAPCPRLEPPSVGVIGSIAKSFANRQIDEPHFGKRLWMPREGGAGSRASLPGARRRLVRARDADALVLGRRHKRSECVVSRRFLSRHACLRSRPPLHRLAAVFGGSRFGATERRPRTFDTASRRTKDERAKITTRISVRHRLSFAFRANEPALEPDP